MSQKRLLVLPHIKVHNANALSSPFTIGFPAMTAWLGFTHALQRKLNASGYEELELTSVAVISHHMDLQTYKGSDDFVSSIVGTGNPLDKDGTRSAFIEEARCHLDVTLVIEYDEHDSEIFEDEVEAFIQLTEQHLHTMKLAGGDILDFNQPQLHFVDEYETAQIRKFTRSLMPGYAIIERRELMQESMQNGNDALAAMLEYLQVNHQCEQDDDDNITWTSYRKTAGWIVPIATGFHGISELSEAKNQRDPDTPHRFAEAIVTLGEFKMPYQIKSLDDMLWHYHTDLENNLYLCQQNNKI
ncbi:type I-F CRISPR-associated protein Csy2 [Flocculibacter collagenilyticus]|uniref:type I-F CRISPR-associated protein Csy2 n=1 Tax=Flocculibacter collagenilyticus TaxID=2744479 RepID=UPI0018F3720C|nr:type I-F CRISPR-associated protein Csy2 [Flocculibacter collagenilyticus]